ncbi:MAG: class I SAM-dependent methyltransferase [Acidobacteriota bacterium]
MRDVPFRSSLSLRLWRRREAMRSDWEIRARENAPFYICTTAAETPEAFAVSGERDLAERVIDGLPIAPDWHVLEIGCGIGRLLRPLSERVAHAVGVDVSEEMIVRAREYCAGRPNVALHRTDGDLGFLPDGEFDFAFSHIVFQHLPRKAYVQRYLREAARLLKPGGILRVQVDGRSRQFYRRWFADSWSGVVFSERELARRLEKEGFRVTALEGAGTQYLRATAFRKA